LRSLPKLRAPRNFTLTPGMAGQRMGASLTTGLYPLLRLAATLATIFFFIMTAGGLALRFTLPAQTVVMRTDQSQNAQSAPNFGMGGGNEAPALPLPAPTEAAGATTLEKAPAPPGAAEVQVTPVTPSVPEGTPDESQPGVMPKALSAIQQPPEAQAPVAPAPQELVQQEPARATQAGGGVAWTLLTVLQILLAVLALACGAAALVLRRLGRR
jgi:hypothetical protein